jgi:hypothetical protein
MAAIPFVVMVAGGAWLRRSNHRALRRWLCASFLASLPFVAWLGVALWHRASGIGAEWQFSDTRSGWGPGVLADFFVYGTTGALRMAITGASWALPAVGAGVGSFSVVGGASSADRQKMLMLGLCATLPIVLLAAMPHPAIKYAFVGLPAAAALIGHGAIHVVARARARMSPRAGWLVAGVMASAYAAVLAGPLLAQLHGPRVQWDRVGKYIEDHERPGDLVYAGWFIMELSLAEEYHGQLPVASAYPYDPSATFDERFVRYAGQIAYPQSVFDDLEHRVAGHDRVFVVIGGDNALSSPLGEWFVTHRWQFVDRLEGNQFTPGVWVFVRAATH